MVRAQHATRRTAVTATYYYDWATDWDTRLSYYNPKYPWIEAVHHFGCNGARPREWDAARFSIPGRKGSGEYMVHMVWGGYKDVIDVDLLPSEAVDKYGRAATATTWAKTDHCQYVEHGPPSARGWPGTCFPITDVYDDGDSPGCTRDDTKMTFLPWNLCARGGAGLPFASASAISGNRSGASPPASSSLASLGG